MHVLLILFTFAADWNFGRSKLCYCIFLQVSSLNFGYHWKQPAKRTLLGFLNKISQEQHWTHSWKQILHFWICFPEAMFCFCFQSPFLKLQALEADLGLLPSLADPRAEDNPPAQDQPLSIDDQSLFLTHKLQLHQPPSSTPQDQHTVNSSQSGKSLTMDQFYSN